MTSEELLCAIGRSDAKYLQEVLDHMDGEYKKKTRRVWPRAILIAAVVALLAMTAYAAGQYFGIMNFPGSQQNSLPSQAAEMIETRTEAGSQEGISYRLKETLTDGGQIVFVVEIKTNEPEKYFLVPEMILDSDALSYYGFDSDLTFGEYKAQTGLIPLNVNASIRNADELGITVQSTVFWSLSSDTAELRVSCNAASLPEGGTDVECSVTAIEEGGDLEDVIRGSFTFPLEYETSPWEEYKPQDPNVVDGMTIQKAEVRQTELYTYIRVYCQGESGELPVFEIPGTELREGSGGTEPNCYTMVVDRQELGDAFTIQIRSLSKDVLGTVTFGR